MDELSGKWMKTAVSIEADEKKSMSDGRPDGEARRSDEGGPRYPTSEQGRRTPGRVPNGGWVGTRRRAHGCLTESGSGPTEGGVLEGGPTAEYTNGGGP
jgi:hypothetical protein